MLSARLFGSFVAVPCALAAVGGFASNAATARPGVHAFEARLRDGPTCGVGRLCGTGTLSGFGAVKTQIVLVSRPRGPAARCTGGAGTRVLTLVRDAKSTLRLSVEGAVCGSRAWGTFKVASGSGVFAGATGSGVIRGTFSKTARESLRYTGVLTLPGK